jgi:hypothetical protein
VGSTRRYLLALGVGTLAVSTVALSAPASAHDDHGTELRAQLVGSTPSNRGGPTLFGVTPGGVPWVVSSSKVRLRDGELRLRVTGLVIPAPAGDNTAGGVDTVTATVFCNGMATPATMPVPLSDAGDARIRQDVALPHPCLAPAVLVHPNGRTGAYIAATGL